MLGSSINYTRLGSFYTLRKCMSQGSGICIELPPDRPSTLYFNIDNRYCTQIQMCRVINLIYHSIGRMLVSLIARLFSPQALFMIMFTFSFTVNVFRFRYMRFTRRKMFGLCVFVCIFSLFVFPSTWSMISPKMIYRDQRVCSLLHSPYIILSRSIYPQRLWKRAAEVQNTMHHAMHTTGKPWLCIGYTTVGIYSFSHLFAHRDPISAHLPKVDNLNVWSSLKVEEGSSSASRCTVEALLITGYRDFFLRFCSFHWDSLHLFCKGGFFFADLLLANFYFGYLNGVFCNW